MPVSFEQPAPASVAQVEGVEERLQVLLPGSFRSFLMELSNGGWVTTVGCCSGLVGVRSFMGASRGDELDIEVWLERYRGRIPNGLLPVAEAEGGNLVCLSLQPESLGSVWFWDHEFELSDDALIQIAATFDAFVDELAPIPEAELTPTGRVVWVDPTLLAEFGLDQPEALDD